VSEPKEEEPTKESDPEEEETAREPTSVPTSPSDDKRKCSRICKNGIGK